MRSFFDVQTEEIYKRMNAGELPPQFIDVHKICSVDNPDAIRVTIELERIVHNILEANKAEILEEYGIDTKNFKPRILLSLEFSNANAFTLPALDKQPVIVVNLALLEEIKSEDELAGILSHEIHHILLPRRTNDSHQGQLGECACDVWATKAMRNASYQPGGVLDFFERRHGISGGHFFSSHPPDDVRIIQIKNTVVALDKTYGKNESAPKKLIPPPKILSSCLEKLYVQKHNFQSELYRILEKNGYDNTRGYEDIIGNSKQFAIIATCIQKGLFDCSSGCLYQHHELLDKLTQIMSSLTRIPDEERDFYFKKLQELRDWLIYTNYNSPMVKQCNNWIKETYRGEYKLALMLPNIENAIKSRQFKPTEGELYVKPGIDSLMYFTDGMTEMAEIKKSELDYFSNTSDFDRLPEWSILKITSERGDTHQNSQDHLYKLKKAISHFVRHDQDYTTAKSTADMIVNLLLSHYNSKKSQEYLHSDQFRENFRIDSFKDIQVSDIKKLKKNEFIIPSWHQMIEYSLEEYKKEGTTVIATALHVMGVTCDPRLKFISEKLIYPYVIDTRVLKNREKLTVNEIGYVINPIATPRQEQEKELLSKINWDELREPPVGLGFNVFTEKYLRYLRIEFCMLDSDKMNPIYTNYDFANEFIKYLARLPAQEITKIKNSGEFNTFFEKIFERHREVNTYYEKIFERNVAGFRPKINIPFLKLILDKELATQFFSNEEIWRTTRNNLLTFCEYYDFSIWNQEKKTVWYLDNVHDFGIIECDFIYHASSPMREFIPTVPCYILSEDGLYYVDNPNKSVSSVERLTDDQEKLARIKDILASNMQPNSKKRLSLREQKIIFSVAKHVPEIRTFEQLNTLVNRVDLSLNFEVDVLCYEAIKFIKKYGNQIKPNDFDLFDKILHNRKMTEPHFYEFRNMVLSLKEERLAQALINEETSVSNLHHCIDLYRVLNRYITSSDNDISAPFFQKNVAEQQRLMQKIWHLYSSLELSTEEKIVVLEKLIFRSEKKERHKIIKRDSGSLDQSEETHNEIAFRFIYSESFPDPELRKKILDSYLNTLVTMCNGKDDDRPIFADIARRIISSANSIIGKEILVKFADKVTAQESLSSYIDINLAVYKQRFVEDNYIFGDLGFRIVNSACGYTETRHEFLHFLLNPCTEQSCQHVYTHTRWLSPVLKHEDYNDNYGTQLRLFHKQFWDSEPVTRAALLQKLLYSRDQKNRYHHDDRSSLKIHEEAYNYVLKRIFHFESVTEKKGQEAKIADTKDYTEERKVIDAYLKASTDGERSALLSLMLASQEPTLNGSKKSSGQILKLVLDNLGPAGTKLAQAINSHPQTPPDIRKDTAQSKSMANKPARWELFKLIADCYGDKVSEIIRVGDILGAGTYGVTVEIEKKDGQRTALTLLRDYAYERATTEFDTLARAADHLMNTDPRYELAISMVRQADQSSSEETNMDLACQQDEIAQRLYNSMEIRIGDDADAKIYTFSTATWIGHGPRYKETAIVPGQHFMDLPETTKAEKSEKRNLAIAILTIELHNIVSGKEFDHDRHGAQQRISGRHIGQFDFGGIALIPPTKEEKELIGKVIGRIMREVEAGKPLVSSLQKALRTADKKGENKEFLARIERTVLALNEYAPFVTQQDFISIFATIRKKMDPIIAKSLGKTLVGKSEIVNYFFANKALSQLDKQLEQKETISIILSRYQARSSASSIKSVVDKELTAPISSNSSPSQKK